MEELIKALKQIEQFSDVGDDFLAVCKMKSIATDALKAQSTPTKEQIEAEAEREYPDSDTLSAYERIILKNERAAFIKGVSLNFKNKTQ